MKTILIDDEPAALRTLKNLIDSFCPNLQVQGSAQGVRAGVELIQNSEPDLVFLDINMGDGTGFDLLDYLPKIDFKCIFTTAYDKYAIKAFRYSATDYLLKPLDPMELTNAIRRCEIDAKADDFRLNSLKESMKTRATSHLTLPGVCAWHYVHVNDIIRCEGMSNYTDFYLTEGRKITIAKTLKDYEEILPADLFYRSHKSYLVNRSHIRKVIKSDPSYIQMSDGTEVGLARRKRQAFLEWL